MVRKVLFLLCIIYGGYTLLAHSLELFDIVAIVISSDGRHFPIRSILYSLLFIAIGFVLMLVGYKRVKGLS